MELIQTSTYECLLFAVKEFNDDECSLRASALTFYSLLAIVPLLAFAFGIAKGFGIEALLEQEILERLQGHEAVMSYSISFARNLLKDVKGGVIAGIGIVALL